MLTSKYINRTKMNIILSENLNKFGTFLPLFCFQIMETNGNIWKHMETNGNRKRAKRGKSSLSYFGNLLFYRIFFSKIYFHFSKMDKKNVQNRKMEKSL